MSGGDKKPSELDIKALLKLALDEAPTEGFTERVMNQLAGARTAIELSRLVAVSPFDWLHDEDENAPEEDENAPEEDENAPVEDENAPVEEEDKPTKGDDDDNT